MLAASNVQFAGREHGEGAGGAGVLRVDAVHRQAHSAETGDRRYLQQKGSKNT